MRGSHAGGLFAGLSYMFAGGILYRFHLQDSNVSLMMPVAMAAVEYALRRPGLVRAASCWRLP